MQSAEDLAGLSRAELVQRVIDLQRAAERAQAPPRGRADSPAADAAGAGVVQAASGEASKRKGKASKFDMSKYRQRHIALHVSYIGNAYHGLAIQEGGPDTVETKLFEALERTRLISGRTLCSYSRCGRTDKGVSACGQVIALHLRSALRDGAEFVDQYAPSDDHDGDGAVEGDEDEAAAPAETAERAPAAPAAAAPDADEMDYPRILNRVLPADIRIMGWCPVPQHFSARFSCAWRTYRYYFVRGALDLQAMAAACDLLRGAHDFRHFAKMDVVNVSNFVREVFDFSIKRLRDARAAPYASGVGGDADEVLYFEVRGTAFLWHQVRRMVAVLLMVGAGRERPEVVSSLLDVAADPRCPTYQMAPEQPLNLHHCHFPGLHFRISAEAHAELVRHLNDQWYAHSIETARAWDFLQAARALRPSYALHPAPNKAEAAGALSAAKRSRAAAAAAAAVPRAMDAPGAHVPFVELRVSELKYQPLLTRERTATYEQMVSRLGGAKLQRFGELRGLEARSGASREGGSDARQRARQAIRDMAAATAIDALDSGSSDALVVAAAAAVLISELDTDTDEPAAEGAAAQPHKRARSGASAPGT